MNRPKIIFPKGRIGIYLAGFNTGGGSFEQIGFKKRGKKYLQIITIPFAKFKRWFDCGFCKWKEIPHWAQPGGSR